MIKLSPIILTCVGIADAGIGFLFLSKYEFETVWTYEQKYRSSTLNLNGDERIWQLRMESMKATTPDSPELRAVSRTSVTKSLAVLKKVCGKIYKTDVRNGRYLNDFKRYCVKHNEDLIFGKNWTVIREGSPDNRQTLIDSKLASLQKHRKYLDRDLASIRDSSEDNREALKRWCTKVLESLYEGSSSTRFLNFLDYCVDRN
ncbi:hypothetical protein HF1_07410 [Mycoplasma haemofelis str. Langford 1]|uniref:Uncharacterized protein n=1 Tax=Mycoplasma haemofelis (strain Langford 1) TaxID=941640 RepID=E8ZHX8_MYCHL|nr:hypothetical protein [Mycoplasma haemofelis]CBY92749.1 hypothetical protein HF1_07410 [Mycoplasma haemofelis str. Langford 1]